MDLHEYEAFKFELAAILREAWTGREADPSIVRASRELFGRLAEDRFNVVVMGRFNRGKTSVMNAMLSTSVLPVGTLPLTSVVTTVAYGSSELAIIEYENRRLPDRVSVDRLAEYVTEQGNSGNARRITSARVELPAELLLRGFFFVDTPGLGSSIVENTRAAEAFFPEADAIVLVTSYDSPLSEEEMRVLVRSMHSSRATFLLLNKRDVVSAPLAAEIEAHVREQLVHALGSAAPPVFAVSAQSGAGLADFERALTRFLIEGKQREFMKRMCARAAEVLESLPDAQIQAERLAKLRLRIGNGRNREGQTALLDRASAAPRLRSCVACRSVQDALYAFVCRYQYDLIADESARRRLAENGGLCEVHLWLYASVANPRGVCIALSELARHTVGRLRHVAAAGRQSLAKGDVRCSICATLDELEERATRSLAQMLSGGAKEPVPDVCLPHLRRLSNVITSDDEFVRIVDTQARALEGTSEDMQRYVLKLDALRRELLTFEEQNAARSVLEFFGAHESTARR